MNNLADLLNERLEQIAANYVKLRQGRPSWNKGSRLITINPDKVPNANGTGTYGLFDGHRFCEPDAKELESDNVWFFGSLDHDDAAALATYKREIVEVRASNETLSAPGPPTPEFLVQSFHPKTGGMRAIKEELQRQLQKYRPAESGV